MAASFPVTVTEGVVQEGAPGCHIVAERGSPAASHWHLGMAKCAATAEEDADADDAVDIQIVDIGKGWGEIVVANGLPTTEVAAYVSCTSPRSKGGGERSLLHFETKDGARMEVSTAYIPAQNSTEDGDGTQLPGSASMAVVNCITFIMTLPPLVAIRVAKVKLAPWVAGDASLNKLAFPLDKHPAPDAPPPASLPSNGITFAQFPLAGAGPFLCTQGCGGKMTHFFKESHHAIDLRCPVGTPLLALADGVVTEVTEESHVSGIHCLNLCEWNSISIAGAGGITVEYVHIHPHSTTVKVGDAVKAGTVVAMSGSIGFAPEPHVHIEVHNTDDLRGPSVKFYLKPTVEDGQQGVGGGGGGSGGGGAATTAATAAGVGSSSSSGAGAAYCPVVGKFYGPSGEVVVDQCTVAT